MEHTQALSRLITDCTNLLNYAGELYMRNQVILDKNSMVELLKRFDPLDASMQRILDVVVHDGKRECL